MSRALFYILVNAQILNSNQLKTSFLSQTLNLKDNLNKSELNVDFKTGFETDFKVSSKAKFNKEVDLFLRLLIINMDQKRIQKKKQ